LHFKLSEEAQEDLSKMDAHVAAGLCDIVDAELTILAVKIGKRDDVYKA
jgi:hypothetical protein